MAQSLFVRAPFAKVAGSTAAHYTSANVLPANGQMIVQVDGTNAARLTLQPVFPGKLTFKHDGAVAVPTNPSDPAAASLSGDLYLELAPAAMLELRERAPSLGLPLVFAYVGVTIGPAFYSGTPLRALRRPNGTYRPVAVPGVAAPLNTAGPLANAFARGQFSVELAPTKPSAVYDFPSIQLAMGATTGSITLALGVRTRIGAAAQPARMVDVPAADVLAQPDFAILPILFFYRLLRHLTIWATLAATNHNTHEFYDALDALENAAPAGRWRRLRIFGRGPTPNVPRPPTAFPIAAYDTLSATASPPAGVVLWTSPVSRIGEAYQQRVDNEAFALTAAVGSVPVQVTAQPGQPMAPSLNLQWNAPAANQEPAAIDVTADIPTPDPVGAAVDLQFGAYDSGGRTYDAAGAELAQQELVVPYKLLLASFGFGTTVVPTPAFDLPMQQAVREFQRASLTSDRMVAGAVQVAAVTFAGAVNARIDAATRAELAVWRTQLYRTTTTFHVRRGAGAALQRYNDVGYPSDATRDFEVVADPATVVGRILRQDYSLGIGATAGTRVRTVVNDPVQAPNFPGTTWERRAICAVAENEARVFEALNQYDDAFLSCGLFQWTSGRQAVTGELPGMCSTLAAADFQRLFGVYGLGTANVVGTMNSTLYGGNWTLDGVAMDAITKEELRAFRWGHRFRSAAQDAAFRRCQWDHCVSRLQIVLGLDLTWNGAAITAGQLLQSEFMRAVALDQHVNRPANLSTALQACIDAMLDPTRLISTVAGAATWQNAGSHDIRFDRQARVLYGAGATRARLTAAQSTALQTAIRNELTALAAACTAAQTNLLAIDPGTGRLEVMTQAQHDAFRDMYRWWRENMRNMTDPDVRWNRIVAGGYAGAIGDCLEQPNVLTP